MIRGFVCVGEAAVVVGAVVGGWTAGSAFSPQPAVASAAAAAAASTSGRLPSDPGAIRFPLITPGTVTNRLGA